ncbi:rolling circle replication-associated protein [Methanosarcina sp. UBA289]|uniref:rolling circle replication-associated protein n=1 Tax=Methanosarcina sp. UBA289 TaxID=1915574 RepID=UPI0025DB1C0F|nr:hypothetical protein [Methanosarcina sp. UBA289]
MSISLAHQKTIQEFCLDSPKTIPQIAAKLLLEGKKGMMSLHNFFKTQIAKTIFYIEKASGLIWIRTNPLFFSNSSLDLIRREQSSPQTKTDSSKTYKKLEGLKRTCPEKTEAALILNRVNKFCYYNKENKEFVYLNSAKDDIDKLFKAYCERVKLEKIVLTRAPDNNPVFAQDIIINYQTRFTSPARQKQNLDGFRAAYKKASRRHVKGVFLTLTSNPKGGSLWQINKKTQTAWGKFSKFLGRCLPKRAEWIKVAEFQKNGMLHYHVLIVGINWLLHKSVIQYAWMKYGGGPILDIHTVKNDPVYGWQWSRSCPREAAGKTVGDYLQGYLEKSMSPQHGALYWATGIRNWTCSGTLSEKTKKAEPIRSPTSRYFLKGVLSVLTGFRSSRRKDSISLFSRKLATEKPNKPKKEKAIIPEKPDLSFSTASQITKAYLKSSRGL